MNHPSPQAIITAEEFFALPEGNDCELIEGRVVPRNRGAHHDFVAAAVARQLYEWDGHGAGLIFGGFAGYQCFPESPNRVIRPDASYIGPSKVPGGVMPEGWMRVPPDLAVEVLSPLDRSMQVSQRVRDYLEVGVQLVWIVDSTLHEVRIYRSGGPREILCAEQELRDEAVLSGFACPVSELFAETK